jgi:rubredoxin
LSTHANSIFARITGNKLQKLQREDGKLMDKWTCVICGYVYDPAEGDPDNGVAAGTAWEDVPDDWLCPICGASKDNFEKE